jgi:hypothetical protein
MFLGDRVTPKLIVGGLLAISGVAMTQAKTGRSANLNPEAAIGRSVRWPVSAWRPWRRTQSIEPGRRVRIDHPHD